MSTTKLFSFSRMSHGNNARQPQQPRYGWDWAGASYRTTDTGAVSHWLVASATLSHPIFKHISLYKTLYFLERTHPILSIQNQAHKQKNYDVMPTPNPSSKHIYRNKHTWLVKTKLSASHWLKKFKAIIHDDVTMQFLIWIWCDPLRFFYFGVSYSTHYTTPE